MVAAVDVVARLLGILGLVVAAASFALSYADP
jgi:hypothetical protein